MSNPDDFYTDTKRQLQSENDSLKLANAVVHAIVTDDIQPATSFFCLKFEL